MIYTVTLNPSIDYIVKTSKVELGGLNRASSTAFYPGGKGINVSRVLNNLSVHNTALGFLGGFTGKYIQTFLEKEGITHDFIELEEPTRINVKLKSMEETEINGNGPFISKEKQKELMSQILSLTKDDILILAGSLPPSLPNDFYNEMAKICNERQIPFIIDTSGSSLKGILSYRPFLIKPNQHELGELFDVEMNSVEDTVQYGRHLLDQGVQNLIISMASKGAIFMNKAITLLAQVPNGEVKNSVGAGDSTVAGFLATYIHEQDFEQAFVNGVASGSATAFSEDLCTLEKVDELRPKIKLSTL